MVKQIDFSTLMASSVHDMKNIIAAVGQAYESLLAKIPSELQESNEVRLIKREALKLDAMLVQLLGMYKLEHGQLLLQADYYAVDELFEDLQHRHAELLAYRGVELEIQLEHPDLEGFFDHSLIATVLDNALGNALNYCKKKIVLSAWEQEGAIGISLCDDGPGYPQEMLGTLREREASGIERDTGSTGLGLYFASNIIAMHDQPQRRALFELSNSAQTGGACMQISLPLPSLL